MPAPFSMENTMVYSGEVMLSWVAYRDIRKRYFGENRAASIRNYRKYKKMFSITTGSSSTTFQLAPLNEVCPTLPTCTVIKEEGITPMCYSNEKSEAAVSREYLLRRLDSVRYDFKRESDLSAFFNIHVDNSPKTYKELIDFIKNDKFKLDEKAVKKVDCDEDFDEFHGGFFPFYGIIWDGPVADYDGFNAAKKERQALYTATMDIIVTGSAADGLAALQKYEAWKPTATVAAVPATYKVITIQE